MGCLKLKYLENPSPLKVVYRANEAEQKTAQGFWRIDPQVQKFPNQSPYIAMDGNPILLNDPKGDSTYVKKKRNGHYKVIGGSIDDHNGVYIKNKDGSIGDMIGYSATSLSFYCVECKGTREDPNWRGTIDPNDESGRKFLNAFTKHRHYQVGTLLSYMFNARGGEKYDFKLTNGSDQVISRKRDFIYRGMPIMGKIDGYQVYASARDVGNIPAGFVAARFGFTWTQARWGFDTYQSYQSGYSTIEGMGTQYAQYLGYYIGMLVNAREYYYELSKLPSYGEALSRAKAFPSAVLIELGKVREYHD